MTRVLSTETGTTARAECPRRLEAVSGRIHFWPGGSLWIGRGRGRSEWHAHHAHQLTLALDEGFRFRGEPQGRWTTYEAAMVPSHRPHEFEVDGSALAHLFVEPESTAGRALVQHYGSDTIAALPQDTAHELAQRLFEAHHDGATGERMVALGREAVAALAGTGVAAPAVDARVAKVIDVIRARLGGTLTLTEAAAAAALSPSRLRHLFVQETGTSFRAYVLWLRLNRAIEAATAGASWTEAAHAAGFADSAHLSRTHRRMFGIEPSALRQAIASAAA